MKKSRIVTLCAGLACYAFAPHIPLTDGWKSILSTLGILLLTGSLMWPKNGFTPNSPISRESLLKIIDRPKWFIFKFTFVRTLPIWTVISLAFCLSFTRVWIVSLLIWAIAIIWNFFKARKILRFARALSVHTHDPKKWPGDEPSLTMMTSIACWLLGVTGWFVYLLILIGDMNPHVLESNVTLKLLFPIVWLVSFFLVFIGGVFLMKKPLRWGMAK